MVDAPCGDFFWMQHVDLSGLAYYIGADIVPDMVAHNQTKYGSSNTMFMCLDVVSDSLPQVDLILCRDIFVHFKYEDIFTAINNIKKSKSTYLCVTHFVDRTVNNNLSQTGSWRTINFQLPPFNFPEPFKVIYEQCTQGDGEYADKALAVWKVEDLPIKS